MQFSIAAAVTILLWSLFPLFISSVQSLGTFQTVLIAQCLSLIVWFLYLLFRRESFGKIYQAAMGVKWQILASGLCNAVEYVAFFAALRNTNPVAPTVIFESWIIFMTLFNIAIFRTRLRGGEVAIIALAFLGIAISIMDPANGIATIQSLNMWAMLGLLAALCAGLKASLNTNIANNYVGVTRSSALVPHFLTVQIALIAYLVIAAGSSSIDLELGALGAALSTMPAMDAVYLLIVGGVIMGAANPLFIYSLQRRPTEAHSAIFYLIPLAATFWLIYFGGSDLTYYIASGGFLTLIAILSLTVHGVRFDAMMGAAVVSLLSAYAIITFQKFVDLPRLMVSDRFFVEIAILVFSLIGVFSVERVTTIRHSHEDATRRFVEALLASFRIAKSSRAPEIFDEIGKIVSMVEFSTQRRLPIGVASQINDLIERLETSASLRDETQKALHEWIDTRVRFYPRAHIGFVSLFGIICCMGIIVTATEAVISPIFSLFIISGIGYLIFYLFHLNNPALQDPAQILQPYRLAREIGRPPLISQKCLSTTWLRDQHVRTYRVFSGDPVKNGLHIEASTEETHIEHPEPAFVRLFSEILFAMALAISAAAIILT